MNWRMVDKWSGYWVFRCGVVGFVFRFGSNWSTLDVSTSISVCGGRVVSLRETCPRWCRARHPCRLRYYHHFYYHHLLLPSFNTEITMQHSQTTKYKTQATSFGVTSCWLQSAHQFCAAVHPRRGRLGYPPQCSRSVPKPCLAGKSVGCIVKQFQSNGAV